MSGLELFKRALGQVLRHLDEALAVSGLIWVGLAALEIVLAVMIDRSVVGEGASAQVPPNVAMLVMLVMVGMVVASCWVAVEWHRFALLGERPTSAFPRFHGAETARYFFASLKIGLLIVLFSSIAAGVVANLLGQALIEQLGVIIVFAVIALPAFYAFYRVSPSLTAAAIGEKVRMAEAWRSTQGIGKPIFQTVILQMLLIMFVQLPSMVLGTGVVGTLYQLGAGWIVLMVSVSLLSTIYDLSRRPMT